MGRKNSSASIIGIILILLLPFLSACKPGEKKDPTPPNPPTPTQCESRGTWIWASSISSATKRTDVLQKLAQAKMNTILVSIPPVLTNYGNGVSEHFLEFIKAANNQGLSVHAWFQNGNRKGKISRKRRRSKRYSSAEIVDFRDTAEQNAQVQWVMDVMELYNAHLDGVHLDYIRYFHSEDVNEGGKMDGVSATVAKINTNLKARYPNAKLSAAVFREIPAKEETYKDPPEWKMDVPQWFRDWYAQNAKSIYHGPTNVSVPMFMRYQQDPISWLKDGSIDVIIPMRYTTDDPDWNQTANYFKSFNDFVKNDLKGLNYSLGWIEKSSPTSSRGYDPEGSVRKIKYGRSLGVKGFFFFIFFNHGYDDTALIEALTIDSAVNGNDAPFKEAAESCMK